MLPTPTVSISSSTNPATCGDNGTIMFDFTNIDDGDYTVNYDGGSFTNVVINGGTATVNAPAGNYTNLIITNSEGCTSTTGESITLVDPNAPDTPIVNANAADCDNDGTASISNYDSDYTYNFTPAGPIVNGNGNITNLTSGTSYVVTATQNGCTSPSSNFTIEGVLPAPNINVTATNNEVCLGESVVLTASGGVSYSWNTGSTDDSITVQPTATTTYTVTGTDANGCESTEQVTITINPLPVVEAGNDIELCIANGIVLTAYNPEGATITWDNGISDGVPFTQTENTVTYTVTAELNGCTSTDQVTVSISSSSLLDVEIVPYHKVCSGEKTQMVVNNPKAHYTYSWYYGGIMVGNGPAFIINKTNENDAGLYTLLVENQSGCFEEFTITLEVAMCGIQIPEAFSPNGDGINDYFYVGNLEAYPNSELWIFNRWGIEVYHAENYLNNWDGTSQSSLNMGGNELPEGTYYYILRLGIPAGEYLPGAGKKYNGDVYLKR